MSNTILLSNDPIFDPKDICLTFREMQNLTLYFKDLTFKIGVICLVIGFLIGSVSVYWYYRRKYDG